MTKKETEYLKRLNERRSILERRVERNPVQSVAYEQNKKELNALKWAIAENADLRSRLLVAEEALVKARQALVRCGGEAECCRIEYPQQFADGNCQHCIATEALERIDKLVGEEK